MLRRTNKVPTNPSRVAYIHVGTHKTGTTSIQAFLCANEERFRAAGVLLPLTGRIIPELAAQHNVAWDLIHPPGYSAAAGTFDDLIAELQASESTVACISSEEFCKLQFHPAAMGRLAQGIDRAGFRAKIVVYLRPQVDYLESLFAESIKHGVDIRLADLLQDLQAHRLTYAAHLNYAEMIGMFARTFGATNLIVRAYRESTDDNSTLLREFTSTITKDAIQIPFHELIPCSRLNQRERFSTVCAAMSRLYNIKDTISLTSVLEGRFEPLRLGDILRLSARFASGNARLALKYGSLVSVISPRRLARALVCASGADAESRRQSQTFWSSPLARAEAPIGSNGIGGGNTVPSTALTPDSSVT